MAHYAFLDANNIVQQVIVGRDEDEMNTDWEQYYQQITGMVCKRTSYNTRFGVYYNSETNQPDQDQTKAFRKNYAGIGFTYDEQLDAFIPPKPKFNLIQYQVDQQMGCWVVVNLPLNDLIPFVNDTYAYIVNQQQSVVLSKTDDDKLLFISVIDTEIVTNYMTSQPT